MVAQWLLLLAATTSNVATQSSTASAGTSRAWAVAPPPGTHTCARNNVTRFGPMGCGGSDDQHGHTCCKLNQQDFHCAADTGCNVCPWCCHDSLKDPHSCSSCVAQHCHENLAKLGCSPTANSTGCCPQAQQNASTTLKNVLLVGDSVTNGMSASVAGKLRSVALVQKYIGNDAAGEASCWEVGSASPMGETIKFDVIHFNEGLHSLWPRVNTSAELATWSAQLANFTRLIMRTQPQAQLIYATMTPFQPQKYLNPCRPGDPVLDPCNDVEAKNALAVKTVKAVSAGIAINDLWSVVTKRCGAVYRDCSICDNETHYHLTTWNGSTVKDPGPCGDHYNSPGLSAS
eukprot:COSAG02_NODE_7697_length_2887_cov_15.716284_1_plen_345_part_00